jgi:hypothetical protein
MYSIRGNAEEIERLKELIDSLEVRINNLEEAQGDDN